MGNNIHALFDQIRQEMIGGVNETALVSFEDAKSNLSESYNNGEKPEVYKRTYKMHNSPRMNSAVSAGNTAVAKVYLDQSYSYDTGSYDTPTVFNKAETGGSGIKLIPGFWRKTESKIQKNLNEAMSKRFK